MGNNDSSDFIYTQTSIDDIEMLDRSGATSLACKARINGRVYFMKKLRPELRGDKLCHEVFAKEFNTGKGIKSPYVAKYIDMKDDGDGLYIIMEYVSGKTLKEKIADEPEYFHRKGATEKLLLQLCEALKALHKENVVHLDISPNNIIISQASNDAKLVDLGFCVCNHDDCTPGSSAGFGAPESRQESIKDIDARTDIYAVGRILQYIEDKSGKSLNYRLQRIKKRCLQQQKSKRYHDADEIIQEINAKKTRTGIITALAVIAFAIVTPHIYHAASDYIAWESGQVADKFEEGGFYYLVTDHKARTVEVTYKGKFDSEYMFEYGDGEVKIPATTTHRGRTFRVTSIGANAFDNPETTSILLPDGLETIDDQAFSICRLTGPVYIPKTVTSIGSYTYAGNNFIETFIVDKENPRYDSRDGSNAIIETATKTLVAACNNSVIPTSITTIGEYAFTSYPKAQIAIPDNITTLKEGAFLHSSLTTLAIPASVTEIGASCFLCCDMLQDVALPPALARIEEYTFSRCGLHEIVIPDSVNSIGKYAFYHCGNMQAATIGSGVTEIGAFAFEGCNSLTKVISRIPADKLPTTGSNCFKGINEMCILYVPRGAKEKYQSTHGWNNFAKIVETDM